MNEYLMLAIVGGIALVVAFGTSWIGNLTGVNTTAAMDEEAPKEADEEVPEEVPEEAPKKTPKKTPADTEQEA